MSSSILIDVGQLRVGMYVHLGVSWLHHPFPVSSFRIASVDQIATIRGLGLGKVRYFPDKSDSQLHEENLASVEGPDSAVLGSVAEEMAPTSSADRPSEVQSQSRASVQRQNQQLAMCDQRFRQAMQQYLQLERIVPVQPELARHQGEALVSGCVRELLENGDSAIRLLSENMGESRAMHPINVMVVSLLLGKALGMESVDLFTVGIAALLHDLGKLNMPTHVTMPVARASQAERAKYESHVGQSVACARKMGLPEPVLTAIAQHHEMADGSGFPLRLMGKDIARAGQVLGLVNHFDRLCNPPGSVEALTPHEALSVMFAQLKSRFDPVVLGAFIRMMGVYPPGSAVQLANDRYAIVVSVNPSRPLRPRVIVHDSRIPRDEALVLDLDKMPELSIRRSLKPTQLPRDALDYLSPRNRICYFFERAVVLGPDREPT